MNRQQREKFARTVVDQAYSFRAEGDVLPTWFIHGDKVQIVGTPFDSSVPDAKQQVAEIIAEYVHQYQAEFVIFVSDVWTRTITAEEMHRDWQTLTPPSEMPDAVEAIVAQCWDGFGDGFTLMRQYRMTDDGEIQLLSDDKLSNGAGETETFAAVLEALLDVQAGGTGQ